MGPPLRVLRLCSAFAVDAAALGRRASAYDPVGGMQNHTLQLSHELDRAGVRQTVITAWRPASPRRQQLGQALEVLRFGTGVSFWRQLYAPAALPFILSQAGRVDLIHAHLGRDLVLVPLALLAALRRMAPLVLTVHSSPRHTLVSGRPRIASLARLEGALELLGERQAAAVITLTQRLRRLLLADGIEARRVHVIPSGIASTHFRAEAPDLFPALGHPRIVFVGRLADEKDPCALIDAATRLRHGDVSLLLVGDGPLRAHLESAIRDRGLERRVVCSGFLAHALIPSVLAHAEVLAMPSTHEELGTVLVECLAAGLPVVASEVGGIPEVVEDGVTGLMVPPRAPRAFAAALDRLLDDKGLRARMAQASRARAWDYDWTALAQRVLGVYEEVIRGSLESAYPSGAAQTRLRSAW